MISSDEFARNQPWPNQSRTLSLQQLTYGTELHLSANQEVRSAEPVTQAGTHLQAFYNNVCQEKPCSLWYAVRVKTRAEPTAYSLLIGKGYACLLPMYTERRPYSDRIKLANVALYPGYVFCRFNSADALPILTTPTVKYVVGNGRIFEPIPDQDIHNIQILLLSCRSARPWSYLKEGQMARIEKGPLTGLEGFFVRDSGRGQLILSVHMLRRSVAVKVDGDIVRPL